MRFTQEQIDNMETPELLDNIELAIEEQKEQIKAHKESDPRLREILMSNVEIYEEEEDSEEVENTIEANIIRTDSNPQ